MIADAVRPLIEGRLHDWTGLPVMTPADLQAAIGPAAQREEVTLGTEPAVRFAFRIHDTETLFGFERHGHIVMLEVSPPPDIGALAMLPAPTATLPQEIRIEGAYAHEMLWATRGLWLTVARPLEGSAPDRLVRCRGIRPLAPNDRLPPDLYRPLATRVKW